MFGDPASGDLAVVFVGTAESLAIFPKGSTKTVLYNSGLDAAYCGYDASGNLFVDGFDSKNTAALANAERPSRFVSIAVNGALGIPGQIRSTEPT